MYRQAGISGLTLFGAGIESPFASARQNCVATRTLNVETLFASIVPCIDNNCLALIKMTFTGAKNKPAVDSFD
jgi:hypothetical protein